MQDSQYECGDPDFPLILAVNVGGEPTGWMNYRRICYYYCKDMVVWTLGKNRIRLRGGINAITGMQSILEIDSIVAINNKYSPFSFKHTNTPRLINKTLFRRDKNICAYCGKIFHPNYLTRDHIVPQSKGGKDSWENCVTSCKPCNIFKGDRTLEQTNAKLLFVPYIPSHYEHLILQNRKILEDQMEYLTRGTKITV